VLFHQLGQDLILALNSLLQELDAFLFRLWVGSGLILKSGGPILEQLLLPAVQQRRLDTQFVR
jgi:hypothetical protein